MSALSKFSQSIVVLHYATDEPNKTSDYDCECLERFRAVAPISGKARARFPIFPSTQYHEMFSRLLFHRCRSLKVRLSQHPKKVANNPRVHLQAAKTIPLVL